MTQQPRRDRFSRRALFLATAATGTAALSASRENREAAASDVRLRFGAQLTDRIELTIAATDSDTAKIQPLLDEYARSANITIHTAANPYDDLYAKLNVNLTQATGAFDVISIDDPWMPLFAGGEFLKDLSEMMDKVGLLPDDDLLPQLSALGAFPADTGIRAIPWVGNVQVFAWRTDVLNDMQRGVPETWDDVVALAAEVTEGNGSAGLFGIGVRGLPGHPAATSFLPVLRGYGLDLLDPETSEPQLATPRAKLAIEVQLQLAKQAPGNVEQAGHADVGRSLSSGRIALSGDIWPDQLMHAFDPERSEVADRLAVGAEPSQTEVRTPHVTGCWLLGIPKESENPEAALNLILWLTAREQQKRLALSRTVSPTRLSVFEDPEVVTAMPFMEAVLDAAKHAVPRPRTPHLPNIEQILGRYIADGMLGQISAEEVAVGANEEIRELLVREDVLD